VTFWFLDASVLLAREDADDDQHEAACQLLAADATLSTLDLAYYEVGNVAVRAWGDVQAAARLQSLVAAIAADGGLVRADEPLVAHAVRVAATEGLSVYDAAYVAGAASAGAELVSCDLRDLVNRGLAVTPQQACLEPDR
jgi:predicted nucleic acid-binding protein